LLFLLSSYNKYLYFY